jgi:tetratricopeptide (TPR) repeat protein
MSTNKNALLYLVALAIVPLLIMTTGCKTAQEGPTLKEQVFESLDLYYKGEKLAKNGDYESALETLQASIAVSPRPRAYITLAVVQSRLGRHEEAESSIASALALSPNSPEAKQVQSQLQARRLAPDGGTTAPTENRPATPEAVISKPKPAVPTEQKPEEKPQAAQAVDAVMDDASLALFKEAQAASSTEDWEKSAGIYKNLLQKFPDHSIVLYNYGYALYQSGQKQESIDYFTRATQKNPDFAEAYNDLGVVYENIGRAADAEEAYQKAIQAGEKTGNFGDAYFNLALLKEKMGQYKPSIALYEKYLKFDQSSAFSTYARQRIEKLQRKAN